MSIHLDKQESVGHTQVVEGTYPRDNISREEWGEVTGKGRRGRGQSSGTAVQGSRPSGRIYFVSWPLPPLSSLSNQWDSEAKPLDYRSLREERWGGAGQSPPAHHGQIPQRTAGVQQASGLSRPTSLGRGGATCCSTWSSNCWSRRRAGRSKAQEVTLAKGPPSEEYLSDSGKQRAQRRAWARCSRRCHLCEQTSQGTKRPILASHTLGLMRAGLVPAKRIERV
jgi:hypothetical protein